MSVIDVIRLHHNDWVLIVYIDMKVSVSITVLLDTCVITSWVDFERKKFKISSMTTQY